MLMDNRMTTRQAALVTSQLLRSGDASAPCVVVVHVLEPEVDSTAGIALNWQYR
jgi:hypothetical protein